MKYIELNVKLKKVLHGYDEDNWEKIENVKNSDFNKRMIAIESIRAFDENHLLIKSAFGRLEYWVYQELYDDIRTQLKVGGLLV